MEGITASYTEGQAGVMEVEAGSDLLMGPSTPAGVATMIEGIKQAIASGTISQQRIDDSVRRILMLKYQMGLLTIPASQTVIHKTPTNTLFLLPSPTPKSH